MGKRKVEVIDVRKTDPDYKKIAEAIGNLSEAAKAMRMSGLSKDAVIVLIKYKTGIPMQTVAAVLEAAEDLKKWCLSQ